MSSTEALYVDRCCLSFFRSFEIGWGVEERDVVIDEGDYLGVVAIGKDETEATVSLGDDRHETEIIDVAEHTAEKIIMWMNKNLTLGIAQTKLPVFLKHLVET